MIRLIILFYLLLSSSLAYSQQYYFARYTLNDGLPHSRVNDIIQGKQGYLWMATNLGLSRFDGHKFINYSLKDGLSDNKVTCILELDTITFLLGHENGELSYFQQGQDIKRIKLLEETNRIFNLTLDSKNNVWISTQGSGAFKISKERLLENFESKNYQHFDKESGLARDVTSILEDSQNTIWFLTDLGIKRLKENESEFRFFLPKGIDFGQFSSIEKDDRNRIWLGTVTSGVFRIEEDGSQVRNFSIESSELQSNFISCLQIGKNGDMMVGTWGGGFSIISKDDQCESISEINGLSENKVRCLILDRENNIWIGSNQNGVSCYRGKEFQLFLKSNNGTNTQIGAIIQDKKGNIWTGSNNGIYFISTETGKSTKIDFLTGGDDIEVTSLMQDKANNIWVSTWGAGILIINPVNLSVQRFNGKLKASQQGTFTEQYVHTIKQARNGKIWISMLRGVSAYSPGDDNLTTYTTKEGLTENNSTDIQEDNKGNIWIGSAGSGVSVFKNGKFKPLKSENASETVYPAISSLALDENGVMWIATEGGGIYSVVDNKIERFTTVDGLASNYVSLIESDLKGRLWLGTNKGICVWNPETKFSSLYDRTDRVERIEPKPNSVFRDREDNIWIGTINGVLMFNPGNANFNATESVTHITAIKVFQDTITEKSSSLSYKENYLTFYFNGICYSDPSKVKFRYRLTGFEDEWVESNLNFVSYNNLPASEYVFEIKSCNNDGVWNKEPAKFSFVITPPFWMTWWFYTICVLGLVLIIIMLVKFRERNLLKEKRHLEQIVGERTGEILQQKEEIEQQRDELKEYSNIIEQKNLSITDSIKYAKRIQLATLPDNELIENFLPESFVLYKPKDIVSGDFYAFLKRDSKLLIAVADCTGHGVPGAFMSMIGTNIFNQVINEKGITTPSEILDELNIGIERALKQDETENHDGMDIVVVMLDFENNIFEAAGANRPLWIVRKDSIEKRDSIYDYHGDRMQIIKPDKQPIGGITEGKSNHFLNNTFEFNRGDTIYLGTDGFADQFGGPQGKKLLSKRLRNKLNEISEFPPSVQKDMLDDFFESWRGKQEQVDDVLLVGIKYHL